MIYFDCNFCFLGGSLGIAQATLLPPVIFIYYKYILIDWLIDWLIDSVKYFIFVVLRPSFITIWAIRMLPSGGPMIMLWYMAQLAAIEETWSPLLLWMAYPLLFAYSILLGR